MIITIKNLQQQTFLMEVDPEKTVVQLKEQIYNERGEEYPVEKQNLIYAGIILEDEKTIASYNIRSNKFLVVMIKRDLGLSPSHPDDGGVSKKADDKQNTPMDTSTSAKSSDTDPSTSSAAAVAGGGTNETTSGGDAAIDTEMKNIEKVKNENTASSTASTTSKDGNKQEPSLSTSSTSAGTTSAVASSSSGGDKKREDSDATASDASNKENVLSDIEQRQSTSAPSTSSLSSTSAAVAMSATTRSAESVLLMGDAYNSVVNAMMEMGYSREMVHRALQASFNNPERAVEYLISGIPEEAAEAGLNAAEAAVAAEVGDVLVPDAADADADVSEDPLEFLRSQPQFVQMRALIQQNPDLLNAVLQQIGLTNPALLQLITENQESFLNMLNEPIEGPNPLDPAFFVSIADRHRRSQPGGGAGDNDHNSSDGDLNVVQNRNAADGEINRRSAGDGSVDGIHIDERRMPQNDAAAAAAANAAGGGPGDRLRARAAGFAAALNLGGQNQQQQQQQHHRSGGDSPMNSLGPVMNADGNGGFVDHVAGGRERNASQNQHGRNNATMNRIGGGGGSSAAGGHLPTIRLTPQDQAAIERLTALGFPEALVVQAYFACDKNETLAANFLLNNVLDD